MSNRIRCVEVRDHSAVPAEAEVRVRVVPERRTPATKVRGRLMGPSCPYSSTVEIAYALRPLPAAGEDEALTCRVLIPEASLWDTESPFLYRGPVELWQDGARCDRVIVSHGLRTLQVGPRGLRLNGRPLTLRGRELARCSDDEALALRRAGYNLFVAPAAEASAPLWDVADRLGFLVLGRLTNAEEGTLRLVTALNGRPCCLGWLADALEEWPGRLPAGARLAAPAPADEGAALPPGVSFVVGTGETAGLPLLVTGGERSYEETRKRPGAPPLLGWVG